MDTITYLPVGENTMSETVLNGPTGGMVWLMPRGRRLVIGVSPFAWSTEKHAIPDFPPEFATHAEVFVSVKFRDERERG